jgi:hypothetical protein
MKEQNVDSAIQDSLRNGTDTSLREKEQIWSRISNKLDEIDTSQQKRHQTNSFRAKKTRRWMIITASIASIFLALIITTTTEQGQALILHVRQWLEPEKSIQQELEGTKENTKVNLHQKETQTEQDASFVIYVDEERYQLNKDNGQFRITAPLPEKYPEVYMDISQQTGTKPKTAMEKIKQELTTKQLHVGKIEQVKSPVMGYRLRADQGNKNWNDEVIVYYVVSNKLQGSFIIKQKYFLEASEGHGSRFDNMLKEFKIVKSQP